MSPKKAIIIVLILFAIMAIVFVFLYLSNKPSVNQPITQPISDNSNNTSPDSTGQKELTPKQQEIKKIETITSQQIEQIIEQGQTSTGGLTVDAQRKIDEAVNREIMEKLKLKTPEELKADELRRAELEAAEQQINQQIRDQLQIE